MKTSLSALFILVSLVSNGQFMKGDKFVGGSFSLNSQKATGSNNSTASTTNHFSVTPFVGFLLNEHFSVGAQIGYGLETTKYNVIPSQQPYKWESFNLGLNGKQYFTISEKFLFAAAGSIAFTQGTQKIPAGGTSTVNKGNQVGASITPSFIFFPSLHWAFEASVGSIGFAHAKNLSDDSRSNYFNLNYGSVNLGFSYYFRNAGGKP